MAIPVNQAQGLLISGAFQKYKEVHVPTTHLTGYFTPRVYGTTTIPLSVIRRGRKIAVDVMRGTNGNTNRASIESMKEIIPPFYHEKLNINQLRGHERSFGLGTNDVLAAHVAMLAEEVSDGLVEMKNKIVRAVELQSGQALEYGVVTLNDGSTIDYGRDAGSLVDASDLGEGGYWTSASAKVEAQLVKGANFIRTKSQNSTPIFDITMPGNAWIALQNTDYFKTKANFNKVTLLDINAPQARNGAAYHGRIIAGAYIFNVWTYDETYDNSSNVSTRYISDYKIIITPSTGGAFELAYGAVDKKVNEGGMSIMRGAADYYMWDSVDSNNLSWDIHMTSAPVARLISVDAVYTLTVADDWTGSIL